MAAAAGPPPLGSRRWAAAARPPPLGRRRWAVGAVDAEAAVGAVGTVDAEAQPVARRVGGTQCRKLRNQYPLEGVAWERVHNATAQAYCSRVANAFQVPGECMREELCGATSEMKPV